ncbi:hypothetical protein CDD83_4222 [Cordyceps sp. RAO-2017]|nr:hypothetical protein CDD83_4222 [Cordyceps sp. RAO-2017]
MTPSPDYQTRTLVLGLKAGSVNQPSKDIATLLGLNVRQVNRIYSRALERGFDPNKVPLEIVDDYVRDAPRTGRPTKQTQEAQDRIVAQIADGRGKSCADLALDLSSEDRSISASTVRRILKKAGVRPPRLRPGPRPRSRQPDKSYRVEPPPPSGQDGDGPVADEGAR